MSTRNLRLAITVAAALMPSVAWAQHETHQAGAPQAASPELTQCVRMQPALENIIAASMARTEAARLSNSPTDLRGAVDYLEGALRDIRAQLAPCFAAAASTDPHAGHTMPSTQTPASATDPHAGHTMPSTSPASKGATTEKPVPSKRAAPAARDPHAGHTTPSAAPSKPAAKPKESKAADPHAGHSAAQPSEKQMDPVNGLMVDPATAPQTTYQGQTYYFSSEQSQKEFLENPAKFAKKPKG